MTFIATINMVL